MIKSDVKLLFVEYFIQTYYMPATFTKTSPSLRTSTFHSSNQDLSWEFETAGANH